MKALPEASALGKRLPRLQLHLCFLGQTVLQLGCSCASVLVVEAFPFHLRTVAYDRDLNRLFIVYTR